MLAAWGTFRPADPRWPRSAHGHSSPFPGGGWCPVSMSRSRGQGGFLVLNGRVAAVTQEWRGMAAPVHSPWWPGGGGRVRGQSAGCTGCIGGRVWGARAAEGP